MPDRDHPVGGNHHVPGVADIVGEHGGAKSGGQRDAAIVGRAGSRRRRCGGGLRLRGRQRPGRKQQSADAQSDRRKPRGVVMADEP
jgi:hypothetical protein